MAENQGQSFTVTAPEGYKPEEGKPIQFDIPVSSLDLSKIVPKEIGAKPYFEKIKTVDDLFKTLDGAQELLGKKNEVKHEPPAADAPQEVWDAYLAKSRAAKPDDYTLEAPPDTPDELKATPEFSKAVKQMFYDAGITPRQASLLQKGYDALMMGAYKDTKGKQAAIDKQFMELVKPVVGEKPEEQAKNFAESKAILTYLLPKEFHPFISKTNNEGLALMVALTKAVKAKYMKEDEIPRGDQTGGGSTRAELQTKARALMVEKGKLDPMDPKRGTMQKEIDELYKQIALL